MEVFGMNMTNAVRKEETVPQTQAAREGSRSAVTPLPGIDGLIVCPVCKKKQQTNRTFCYKCETPFAK